MAEQPTAKVKIMLCDRVREYPEPGPVPCRVVPCYGCKERLWIGVESHVALGVDGVAVCQSCHAELMASVKASGVPPEVAPVTPGQLRELDIVMRNKRRWN